MMPIKQNPNSVLNIEDKRFASIAERTLNKNFQKTYSEIDLDRYSICLIKETVLECMKQLAIPVDMNNSFHKVFVEQQWDHLARRFGINEK